MQVNNAVIGSDSSCHRDINSDPVWSEKLYTPISNKPPPGKPFTLQHLPFLLFGDFTIVFFLFSKMSCFEFVRLHQLTFGKLVSTVLPNNPRL
jgi:hypothetical protein